MKKHNYIMIYDDQCPLCDAYTRGFVKAGLLEKDNRIPFSNAGDALMSTINISKAVNEIPLVDTDNHTVYYGIDALLQVLDQKIPLIKKIGNIKPVKWFLLKMYKLISYNRKVIVAKRCGSGDFDCSPVFSTKYRALLFCIGLAFNTLMLFPLQQYVLVNSLFSGAGIMGLQIAHFVFVAINISLSFGLTKQKRFEYLGQVNMLALLVVLLCLPLVIINKYTTVPAGFNDFALGMVTILIVKDYFRRMRFAGIFPAKRPIFIINLTCLAAFLLYLYL